ncbi:MAG: BsuBI/PstI family type II restriction endonuclease, partial [Gammaproteobacteria bacterium]
MTHVDSALQILRDLGLPRAQLNDRSALTLLALLDLKSDQWWKTATAPLMGITPVMDWIRTHYGRNYAPNTRETFRRQTMHQFVAAGLVAYNPDKPDRPVNSPAAVYQLGEPALKLLRIYGSHGWARALATFRSQAGSLAETYAR